MKKTTIVILIISVFGVKLFGQSNFSEIKTTTETETTIKSYLNSSSIDPIEGIYKTTSGSFYKIAIKKYDDTRYLAIILDSENKKKWKEGTVKAYIEKSATDAIFSLGI